MEKILSSRSCRSLVIGLALMIGGTASRSSAQSTTAALTGDVVDPQGAVVPGATVSAIHADSGFKKAVETNSRGTFVFPPLPPGRYRVETQRKDFATAVIPALELNVNDRKNIRIPLTVGTIEQSIEVTGTLRTNNRSAAVYTVIDRQFANELPLNGRSFDALISLTPGSAVTTAQSWEPGQFSINGQRPNANYFTVDGVGANTAVSHTDHLEQTGAGTSPPRSALGGTNNFVPVDAVQEFRLETSSYAPEFGRMPGAQASIITRSGSNQFHGTVFDYFRNDALDANDWFANSQHLEKAALRQNDFGGVLSGPIVQNRTFFFASYEGLRLRLPQVAALTLVPSMSVRQAAPLSVQPLLNAFPIPNGKDLGDGTAEFSASASNPSTVNAAGLRIDHRVNARLSLFGRYHQADSNAVFRGGLSGGSFSNFGRSIDKNATLTIGAVSAFGPRINNDFRFNYSAVTAGGEFLIDNFGGAATPPASALFPPSVDPATAGYLFQFLRVAGWNYGPASHNRQRQINIVDNVTTGIENHVFRFGVDYRRLSPITQIQPYSLQVAFNSSSDVLSGLASFIQVNASKGSLKPIFQNFSAYAQDAWRIRRRLTLTYGLRWELNPPPGEANGELPYTVQGLDNPANLTLAPKGTAMYTTTYGNFAPRVAAAYTLFETPGRETVLRGGFGVFYDLGSGTASSAFYAAGFSNGSSQQLSGVQFPLNPEVVAPPSFSASPPYPLLIVTDPDLALPRTYEWNVAVEQSVGRNQSVTVSYVGAAGRQLLRREFIAKPNSNFNPGVEVTRNGAVSNYAALQVQFQRRLARGVQALSSYTWSHSLDNDSFESEAFHPTSETEPKQDYGSSSFDLRHSFSAGVTWNIPGPAENRGIARLFHSWAVDTILRMNSAPPVDVISSFGFSGTTRPDLVPGVPLYIYDRALPGGRRINPAAFTFPPPQNPQGTLSRNALRGFPVSQTEMALVREFALSERVKLHFRTEAFNVFNHPNFASPVRRIRNTSQFGRSTSMLNNSLGFDAGLNPLYQIGGARSLQLSLKLSF